MYTGLKCTSLHGKEILLSRLEIWMIVLQFKIPHSKSPIQILLLILQKYPWTDVFKVAHIVVIKFNALTWILSTWFSSNQLREQCYDHWFFDSFELKFDKCPKHRHIFNMTATVYSWKKNQLIKLWFCCFIFLSWRC